MLLTLTYGNTAKHTISSQTLSKHTERTFERAVRCRHLLRPADQEEQPSVSSSGVSTVVFSSRPAECLVLACASAADLQDCPLGSHAPRRSIPRTRGWISRDVRVVISHRLEWILLRFSRSPPTWRRSNSCMLSQWNRSWTTGKSISPHFGCGNYSFER